MFDFLKKSIFLKNGRLLFLLAYSICLIFLDYKLVIWEDEAFSLNTVSGSFFETIHSSYFFEGQPPVYFTILYFWNKLLDGVFFSRLLSSIFILLSGLILDKVGRLIFKEFYSKLILILFLLNPFTIWAASEIRLYALVIFLSFTSFYLFYLVYIRNELRFKWLFFITCLLGIYTQYFFSILVFAYFIIVLKESGLKGCFDILFLSFLLFLLFIPNLLIIPEQYKMHLTINPPVNRSFIEWLGCLGFSPFQVMFAFYKFNPTMVVKIIILFVFIFFTSFIVYRIWVYRNENGISHAGTLLQILIPISIILIFYFFIFSQSTLFYTERYMAVIFPFYCLLLFFISSLRKFFRLMVYISFISYYLFLTFHFYKPPFLKLHNSKAAASYIEKIQRENEHVFFRHTSVLLCFKKYFHGSNPLIDLPERKFDFNYYHYELKDTLEFRDLINSFELKNNGFILVSSEDSDLSNKSLSNQKLDLYILNNFKILRDTIIQGRYSYGFLRIRQLIENE